MSRQAVTKWETETGIPDIENMMAISALFDSSIDELLSNERGMKPGFFIDRPVFSTVLSLVIVIVGIIGLVMLPVDVYKRQSFKSCVLYY